MGFREFQNSPHGRVFVLMLLDLLTGLEVAQHGLRITDFEWIGGTIVHEARFDKDLFDFAINDMHAVAPGTVTETEIGFFDEHAHFLSEVTVPIRKHEDVLQAQMLRPLEHHEGVVDTKANYFVDAEFFEFIVSGFVAWSMSGGASWGESTRQGEDDDVFATKDVLGGAVLPAEFVWTFDGFVADTGFKDDIRDFLTFFEVFHRKRKKLIKR